MLGHLSGPALDPLSDVDTLRCQLGLATEEIILLAVHLILSGILLHVYICRVVTLVTISTIQQLFARDAKIDAVFPVFQTSRTLVVQILGCKVFCDGFLRDLLALTRHRGAAAELMLP